jgi:hypothetical protein
MNHCSICWSARVQQADALFNRGAKLADVARATGLSQQALGRHKRNGHVLAPPKPAPTPAVADGLGPHGSSAHPVGGDGLPMVWVFSPEEDACFEASYEAALPAGAAMLGIPADALRACIDGHRGKVRGCPACRLDEASWLRFDRLEAAIAGAMERPHAVGGWVTRTESDQA